MIDCEKLKEFIEVISESRKGILNSEQSILNDEHKKILVEWYINENSETPITNKVMQIDDSKEANDARLSEINKRPIEHNDSNNVYEDDDEPEIEEAGATLIEMTFKEFQDNITDEPIAILSHQNLKDIYNCIYSKGFKILKIELDKEELYDKIKEK